MPSPSQSWSMTMHLPGVARIRARHISNFDVPAVTELLARGFPERSREFWGGVFARLEAHPVPAECPKYGYLLESGGAVVGAILVISSQYRDDPGAIRCNVSSWFVEPAFRSYASLLVSKALSLKHVTYLNITPAPQTIPLLRVQGYSQYSKGVFVAVPALQLSREDSQVKIVKADAGLPVWGKQFEQELLLEHSGYGCLSLWCVTEGQAYPFVFRPRALKGVMPCAQLIYSRDIDDFTRLAGPLGRWLAARGRLLVLVDANGPIPGLIGKYLDARQPKFFRGPERPRLGDLVYTETAMFGI